MALSDMLYDTVRPVVDPFPSGFQAALAPARPLFVIGDIHGCLGLLEQLLEKLSEFWTPETGDLVFVGDYIDRGEHSAQVIQLLRQLEEKSGPSVRFLMGNHERMMLDFLDRPTERGQRWLRYGGLQAMLSFGLRGVSERMDDAGFLRARDRLRTILSDGTEAWLRGLDLSFQSGNVWVVHAAAKPSVPMGAQEAKHLLWGQSQFETHIRTDQQWVVHGHTIVEKACATQGRISVDTGGYASGVLTAACIAAGGLEFVTT